MSRSLHSARSAALLLPCLLLLPGWSAQADEDTYTPPPVPKLYESAAPEDLAAAPIAPRSHIFTGGGVSFGQSRSTGGESPRPAFGASLELGYASILDSWTRLETSLELNTGSAGHSEAELSITTGLQAKLGYGYTLARGVTGVMRGGVGAVFARYSDEPEGVKRRGVGQSLGTAVSASYLVNVAMSPTVNLRAGLSGTHLSFNIAEVETSGGERTRLAQPLELNVPAVELGLRIVL